MIAVDTEDDSEGNVGIINFFDGKDHVTFEDPINKVDVWNYLTSITPNQCWATNMEYDLLNVFGGDWLGKLCTIQYVNAGFLKASYNPLKAKKGGITFYDTLRHWAISVEEMGKIIGLPKLEQNFQSVEYCRRDTEIVWFFVEEMITRYESLNLKLKSTLPAMGLQFLKQFTEIPSWPFPSHILEWLRKGYYGGRVEVYRMGPVEGRTNHYDFNSLFPAVMRSAPYPDVNSWRVVTDPKFDLEGMAELTIDIPPMHIPPLPYHGQGEIIYPYGRIHGVWTYPEIRQALQDGGKIVRVEQALEFTKLAKPFESFIDYCYDQRQKAQGPFENGFWKLLMNSTYGKFGQKGNLQMIYNDRDFEIEAKASHANVIWSAYVTSHARVKLLNRMRECSYVFYTDTDSIFTPDVLLTSPALGELKKEGEYGLCNFIGNKLYT